jgi:hypothetical protein
MPGSTPNPNPIDATFDSSLGTIYPGGTFQIVSGTQASPTVITTLAPHGLSTGDTIFFTASTTANVALTAAPQQVVTVVSPTTFSVAVNDTTAGATAGAYDLSIVSIPTTPGAAPLVNVGAAHGFRIGDTVTNTAAGSTPSLDGAQVITAIDDPRSFRVLTSAAPTTVAGSTTAAHVTKTTFYSDVYDRGHQSGGCGLVITSVAGTAPVTTLVDIQGSFDAVNYFNTSYATLAAPQTLVVAQLTIVTGTTTNYKLPADDEINGINWRFLRLKFSSSTNIVVSARLHTST